MGRARTKVADSRKPKHGLDANRPSSAKKGTRDAATVRRLKMYSKTAKRDKKGKVIHQEFQSKDLPNTRIQPDRRWFGNTRVVGQQQLDRFRNDMSAKVGDAYSVVLKEKKLPMSLLADPEQKAREGGKAVRSHLLQTQPFSTTFGKRHQRKRPRLSAESYGELLNAAGESGMRYETKLEDAPAAAWEGERDAGRLSVFEKGQSKRIWGELYKVLDSSDVVIQVLDARDPQGTRCPHLERHLRRTARHKHLLFLLNKCDLVPAWVTKRWLSTLSKEHPTLAFHASVTNPFGKGSLLGLLRQLSRLHSDKKFISVGFIGYPNVGKSSVINTLRTKKVCKVAPVPGETKVWQYITLTKRIFLIDCPGVVSNREVNTDTDSVLKGVSRVENLEDATEHVAAILVRVKPAYLTRAYKVKEWADATDFLTQVARGAGKLARGGEPDLNTAARMVLLDWQRGKLPFFSLPADYLAEPPQALGAAGTGAGQVATEAPAPAPRCSDAEASSSIDPRDSSDAGDSIDAGDSSDGGTDAAQLRLEVTADRALPVRGGLFLPDDEADPHQSGQDGADAGDDGAGDKGPLGKRKRRRRQQPPADANTRSGSPDRECRDDEGLSWEAVMKSVQAQLDP